MNLRLPTNGVFIHSYGVDPTFKMVGVRAVSCQAERADDILTLQITRSLFLRPPETAPLSLMAVPGFSQLVRKGFDVKIDHWLELRWWLMR